MNEIAVENVEQLIENLKISTTRYVTIYDSYNIETDFNALYITNVRRKINGQFKYYWMIHDYDHKSFDLNQLIGVLKKQKINCLIAKHNFDGAPRTQWIFNPKYEEYKRGEKQRFCLLTF